MYLELGFIVTFVMCLVHAVWSWTGNDAEFNSRAAVFWFALTAGQAAFLIAR